MFTNSILCLPSRSSVALALISPPHTHPAVYNAEDYVQIMEHLIQRWDVPNVAVSGEAAAAQDYLSNLPGRFRQAGPRAVCF
jgi:hypothetical protein